MNPLLSVLTGEGNSQRPVWLMRQAGRYLPEYRDLRAKTGSFMEFCLNPDLAAEATLQPLRRFSLDGAIIFSDILVIPYAMGQEVGFNEGPVLGPLDREKLFFQKERLAPVYEALTKVSRQLPVSVSLIGFAGAPWTLASYMLGEGRDIARAKAYAVHHPRDFSALLEQLIEAISLHLIEQVKAGAQVLQIFDSWAGALAYEDLMDWSKEPIRKIIAQVKQVFPKIPIIVFPREVGAAYRQYLSIGADALSLDYALPLSWIKEHLAPHSILQGNLDPRILQKGGSALEQAVRHIKRTFSLGRHVFNLGHGILPTTPPEHVAQMIEWIRE